MPVPPMAAEEERPQRDGELGDEQEEVADDEYILWVLSDDDEDLKAKKKKQVFLSTIIPSLSGVHLCV